MPRTSKQKEAIIRVLCSVKSHPDAGWIYEQVKKEIPNISLGTVYRNLRMLKENGDIQELEIPGEHGCFDGNAGTHYHFRCERCGSIFDLDEPVDTAIEKKVSARTGLKITRHRLEFVGLCCECQK